MQRFEFLFSLCKHYASFQKLVSILQNLFIFFIAFKAFKHWVFKSLYSFLPKFMYNSIQITIYKISNLWQIWNSVIVLVKHCNKECSSCAERKLTSKIMFAEICNLLSLWKHASLKKLPLTFQPPFFFLLDFNFSKYFFLYLYSSYVQRFSDRLYKISTWKNKRINQDNSDKSETL